MTTEINQELDLVIRMVKRVALLASELKTAFGHTCGYLACAEFTATTAEVCRNPELAAESVPEQLVNRACKRAYQDFPSLKASLDSLQARIQDAINDIEVERNNVLVLETRYVDSGIPEALVASILREARESVNHIDTRLTTISDLVYDKHKSILAFNDAQLKLYAQEVLNAARRKKESR